MFLTTDSWTTPFSRSQKCGNPWVHDFKIQIFYSEMDPTGQLNFFIRPDFVSDIDFKCLVSQNQTTSVDSLLRIDFKKPNIFMPINGYKPRTGNNCGYLINEWPENGLWSCDRQMNNCIFQCGLKSVVVSCQCQNIGPFIFLAKPLNLMFEHSVQD